MVRGKSIWLVTSICIILLYSARKFPQNMHHISSQRVDKVLIKVELDRYIFLSTSLIVGPQNLLNDGLVGSSTRLSFVSSPFQNSPATKQFIPFCLSIILILSFALLFFFVPPLFFAVLFQPMETFLFNATFHLSHN